MKSLERELGLFSPFTAARSPKLSFSRIYSPLLEVGNTKLPLATILTKKRQRKHISFMFPPVLITEVQIGTRGGTAPVAPPLLYGVNTTY